MGKFVPYNEEEDAKVNIVPYQDEPPMSQADLARQISKTKSPEHKAWLYEQYNAQKAPTTKQKIQSSVPGRIVQGMRDPIDAVAQFVPHAISGITSLGGYVPNPVSDFFSGEASRVDKINAENEADYQASRQATAPKGITGLITGEQPKPGAGVARFVGNVVSPANLAVATKIPTATTTVGRIGTGLLAGGVGGIAQPVDMSDPNKSYAASKAIQIGLGAAGGAIATPILGKIGDKVSQWWANRATQAAPINIAEVETVTRSLANDLGTPWERLEPTMQRQLTDQVMNAMKDQGARINPAVAARKADFQAERIEPTLGQITRDARQFAQEKNLRQVPGIGDPLLQRFEQQGQALQAKTGLLSVGAQEPYQAGKLFTTSLKNYDDTLRKEISASYKAARKTTGKDVELPLQGLAQDAADVIDRFGDKVPSGVVNQLRKYGILPDQTGNPTPRKLFTVEAADDLLHVINASGSRTDDATNGALTALRASVKKAVMEPGADDVFSASRKLAATRFALHEAVPALEDAARGKTAPEDFVKRFIVNGKTEEVAGLSKILKTASPEAYDQARAQIGQTLKEAAFGANVTGDKSFAAERYVAALKRLGTDKLSAFFSKDEIEQMHRLGRLGAYMNQFPNASPVQTSNNWGAIMQLAAKIPGVPSVTGLLGAAKTTMTNQSAVKRSLAAKVTPKAEADAVNDFSKYLPYAGLLSGAAAAQPVH